MMHRYPFTKPTLVPILFAVLLAGCADKLPPAMTQASSFGGAPSGPTIVFVRPSSACDTNDYEVLVDGHGRFLGNLPPSSHTAVAVAPGPHVFYAWSSRDLRYPQEPGFNAVSAIRVNVTAREPQYIALLTEKRESLRCNEYALVDLLPVGEHDALWGDVQDWLGTTKPLLSNRLTGQADLDAKPAHLQSYLELGWAKLVRTESLGAREERREAEREEDSR
jgi:hypothetical protein